jgi:hypothetical protein
METAMGRNSTKRELDEGYRAIAADQERARDTLVEEVLEDVAGELCNDD